MKEHRAKISHKSAPVATQFFTIAALIGVFALTNGCQVQPGAGIPAEQQRVAFQSQCAQNVITCTTRFPTAVIDIQQRFGQSVTETAAGFLVIDATALGNVPVQLKGSGSQLGTEATMLTYSWSFGAVDDDPCTMAPGEEFSTQADTLVFLQPGFHYVRLFVENDVIFPIIESDACGIIGENIAGFHFEEVEIEVR